MAIDGSNVMVTRVRNGIQRSNVMSHGSGIATGGSNNMVTEVRNDNIGSTVMSQGSVITYRCPVSW